MIIILRQNAPTGELEAMLNVESAQYDIFRGSDRTLVSVFGDTSGIDSGRIMRLDGVVSVSNASEPYKLCSRKNHSDDTAVKIGDIKIGAGGFAVIAGPCSVESRKQILSAANAVKANGADILRGGAFKPRTSPYGFQGLGAEALEYLGEAKKQTGLPLISEAMGVRELELFEDVDIIQIGARSMQNYELLTEVGKLNKPVLLKRGTACTIKELLLSAEYIAKSGNGNIILCERGIRGFDDCTRAVLDISAIPVLHEKTHLPVVVDPSHAAGNAKYVQSLALAAVAAGADGLMLEVHENPKAALSDAMQAITPEHLGEICKKVNAIRPYIK